jgi:hypothetical protein
MNRILALLLLAASSGGCSRWAYAPTWRAVDSGTGVALSYDSGAKCGHLSVANETKRPLSVAWSDVHVVLPWGERRETKPWVDEGGKSPPDDGSSIGPGERVSTGLCSDLRMFVVRARPPTVYDFALFWFFGMGVVAGNVAWEPDENKRSGVLPAPEQYGWDLVVPITGDGRRDDFVLHVRGDDVSAFKYTAWAHGEPEALDQIILPVEDEAY